LEVPGTYDATDRGFLAINNFIWYHFRISMISGVVPPFNKGKLLCPLVWIFRRKKYKIGF
jgi:hypothetical protein